MPKAIKDRMDILVAFTTWAQGPISMPWPWTIIEHVDVWKNVHSGLKADNDTIVGIWTGKNVDRAMKFLQTHNNAVRISALLTVESEQHAEEEIVNIFDDAEDIQCRVLSGDQKAMALTLLSS